MQINLAIAALIYLLIERYFKPGSMIRYFIFAAIPYLVFFNIMLSSKAGILGMIIMIFMASVYIFLIRKMLLKGLLLFIFVITYIFILVSIIPKSQSRFRQARETIREAGSISGTSSGSVADRLLIWESALSVFNRNFFTGVGTGDVTDELAEEYKTRGIQHAYDRLFNAHNQYLQVAVALGITGLLVLLLILLIPLISAMRHADLLYVVFLLLLAFNFLFESMLETQAGVVFYAFMNVFLFSRRTLAAKSEEH
jgi:O-antigen ligase